MRFHFIKEHSCDDPVRVLCRVMRVGKSAFYAWKARPATIISAHQLNLYRRAKGLFKNSRDLAKNLNKKDFEVTRYQVTKLMKTLNLVVKQRLAYKVTTTRKFSDAVADNLLNQNFEPVGKNQIWAGDITYLKTGEGWMYLAIVMDLYSRCIVGWAIDKHMSTSLISRAMIKAYNLRMPPKGLVFHSDRGSQYE